MLESPEAESRWLPTSESTFDDGAAYRIEIPSTEGPEQLRAVIESAARHGVVVHRVSQGSGVFMLTNPELDEMAQLGEASTTEVCLFARPTASWGTGATALSADGAVFAGACRGQQQLLAARDDVHRAVAAGIRSVLVSDLGLLALIDQERRDGALPADLRVKVSASLPVTNALTVQVLEGLGADTVNVSSDLTLAQLSGMRAVSRVPFDLYVDRKSVV